MINSRHISKENKVLETPCRPCQEFSSIYLSNIAHSLSVAVKTAPNAIAVAANQLLRTPKNKSARLPACFYYNGELICDPEYTIILPKTPTKEGCLSDAGITRKPMRSPMIQATFRVFKADKLGKFQTKILTGLDAQVFQHETDHLHGLGIWML